MTGACHLKKEATMTNTALTLDQFTSAFLLLGVGLILAILICIAEVYYWRCCQRHLASRHKIINISTLFSLSLGRWLAVLRRPKRNKENGRKMTECHDPLCVAFITEAAEKLEAALDKIEELERELRNRSQPTELRVSVDPRELSYLKMPHSYESEYFRPYLNHALDDDETSDYETAL